MEENTVAYVHSNDTHFGIHQYDYESSNIPYNGPAKYVHGKLGYVPRANNDWVKPKSYCDSTGTCNSKVGGILTAILEINSPVIYTTNMTLLRAMREWLPLWRTNDYTKKDKTPILDRVLWMAVDQKIQDGVQILLIIDTDPGYLHATLLCNLHALLNDTHTKATPYAKEYWNNAIPRNPLLAYGQLCFNSHTRKSGLYLVADVRDSIYDVGKRASYVGYSVVSLNKPDPYIETMCDSLEKDISTDVIGWASLDRLFNKNITRDVKKYKNVLWQPTAERFDYHFVGDEALLIGEVKPVGLLRTGLDNFTVLARILQQCEETSEIEPVGMNQLTSVRITEKIRDGKKIVKELPVGTTHITLPHPADHSKDHIYKLGKSLPNRNKLAALARVEANFYLVHWLAAKKTLRHAVYVETRDGNALYSNFYTDVIIG